MSDEKPINFLFHSDLSTNNNSGERLAAIELEHRLAKSEAAYDKLMKDARALREALGLMCKSVPVGFKDPEYLINAKFELISFDSKYPQLNEKE